MTRCRICSANDHDALAEDVAKAMWDTFASTNPDDEWEPWDEAPPYWRNLMRQFAEATVAVLQAEHDGSGMERLMMVRAAEVASRKAFAASMSAAD